MQMEISLLLQKMFFLSIPLFVSLLKVQKIYLSFFNSHLGHITQCNHYVFPLFISFHICISVIVHRFEWVSELQPNF
jgi:hypothetical protein